MISGQEIMLKDQSTFKTSTGNEAATKSLGMGVVTHTIQGEASFTAWSMDVKVEGANVDRHLDMMIHNEQCYPPNTGPWPYISKAASGKGGACGGDIKREKAACANYASGNGAGSPCQDAGLMTSAGDLTKDQSLNLAKSIQRGGGRKKKQDISAKEKAQECVKRRRCLLGPYSPDKNCCPSQTPDHVLPKASFYVSNSSSARLPGWGGDKGYDPAKAPCMCAEGPNNSWGSHGLRHRYHKNFPPGEDDDPVAKNERMSFDDAKTHAAESSAEVFRASGCSQECIEHQLEQGHKNMHEGKSPPEVKYAPSGATQEQPVVEAQVVALGPSR
jgi:hypothetical protein